LEVVVGLGEWRSLLEPEQEQEHLERAEQTQLS